MSKDEVKAATHEQAARDILERMGIENAQSFSSGEIIELANRLREIEQLKDKIKILEAARAYDEAPEDGEFGPQHPIFQLAEERDTFMFKYRDQQKEIEQLRARVEAAEKDAERYRWLRNHGHQNVIPPSSATLRAGRGPFVMYSLPSVKDNANLILAGLNMDAAIDAQIKAAPQQEQEGEGRE